MGLTIAEKVFSRKVGSEVKAGQFVIAEIDLIMAHDSLGPMAIEAVERFDNKLISKPERVRFVTDHLVPTPARIYAQMQKKMFDFASDWGIKHYGQGDGICHQLLVENDVVPGQLIIGTDSHTCTAGALNTFATGVGSTDVAAALHTGKLWFKVPETIKIEVIGDLPDGIYAKDITLAIIKRISASGAAYKAIEISGDVISNLSIDSRLTVCNMAIEMGAKAGIMEYDHVTKEWFEDNRDISSNEISFVSADQDADYYEKVIIDARLLEPMVSVPHEVDNVFPLKEVAGVPVQEVVIGTCTNGRIEDLEIAASILQGKYVAKGVKLIIVPASRTVLLKAIEKNIISTLIESGASIIPPGCGPCVGVHSGIPADGENVFSTSNRNFKGRMGNKDANIYLGSPAAAAAAALEGKIVDPRQKIF